MSAFPPREVALVYAKGFGTTSTAIVSESILQSGTLLPQPARPHGVRADVFRRVRGSTGLAGALTRALRARSRAVTSSRSSPGPRGCLPPGTRRGLWLCSARSLAETAVENGRRSSETQLKKTLDGIAHVTPHVTGRRNVALVTNHFTSAAEHN